MQKIKKFDQRVMDAIRALGGRTYGVPLHFELGRGHWWKPSVGRMYTSLYKLERMGLLDSEWSQETYPERGNRRRRYYWLKERAGSK
jgi:DNA-binding PadR family transcriptional regulator